MGDLNINMDDPNVSVHHELKEFMTFCIFDLNNLIKAKTCITWGHESLLGPTEPKCHMHLSFFKWK